MTRVYRINTSNVDGVNANNNDTARLPLRGEIGLYSDNDSKLTLVIGDGASTHAKSKVLNKGTFFGGDADSGDGAGLDTIKLVPDVLLKDQGSEQYIVIDPTAPNHIHIRAGGTIDASTAMLFLGGENNNVTVQDSGYVTINATTQAQLNYNNGNGLVTVSDGEVFIKAGNSDGSVVAGWSFNNTGRILFPGGELFKVGNVPTTSEGAPGDLSGTVAFDEDYIYYCTQDYTTGYQATLFGGYSQGPFPSAAKGSYPQPLTGWTFVWNTVTYTLVADATDPNSGEWVFHVDQNIDTASGGTITLYPPSPNIWKRVAWSNDTW